ncbi:hypothetical protein APHAL10511_000380 [Amanita phalloides]|nr:hypothetical protein APHAL10511_000380 [Amanita phalloides]
MGPIQRIWNSERVSIGKTGSGTRGELFEIKGPAGKVGDREIIIKRITGHSSSHNHIEEAVRRESQNQRLVHQRAIDGYGVDLQPGGQVHYYIVLWKLGDRAEKTGLDPNALRQLKVEAWERVAKVGALDIEYLYVFAHRGYRSSLRQQGQMDRTENSDFLFGKGPRGHENKYEYAFPVELSNARLKHNGQFEDLHSDGPAEIFHDHEKCAA